jgi:hypothetical protein
MGEGLFQPMHLLAILVVALLIFGPKAKGFAHGRRGFVIKSAGYWIAMSAQRLHWSGWSLALIGNASERSLRVEEEADPRRFR